MRTTAFSAWMSALALLGSILLSAGCAKEPAGIVVSPALFTLTEGESISISAKVIPEDASYDVITWTSSNTRVATVSDGRVTAVGVGTATITAATGKVSGTSSVTVKAKVIAVEGVSLDKTSITLMEGDSETLVATVAPDNATNKGVKWSSSNTGVATVDETGKVTAVAPGEASITVTTDDGGKTASCAVKVEKKRIAVTGVTIENWSISLLINETAQIRWTVQPADATDQSVSFESSDTSVATVDQNGLVKAVGAGQTQVFVVTADGGYKASSTVKVSEKIGYFEADGLAYKVLSGRFVEVRPLENGVKYSGTVNVPATVVHDDIEYSVSWIGDRAFFQCPDLVAVNLAEGVKYIDAWAFYNCPLLESVALPASFSDFNDSNPVFGFCPKLEITVSPDNPNWFVNDHAVYQKYGNTLRLRYLPEKRTGTFSVLDGTTSLHEYSIYHTSIDKIVIPKSVNTIQVRFFCAGSKTPLEIELYWTTQEEVNAITTVESRPEVFFFQNTDRSKVTVTVPKGTKALYEAHWLWSALGGITERE